MATANLTDMSVLATDPTFGNRVLMALTLFCSSTGPGSDSITTSTVQLHVARKNYAAAVLNNPANYKPLFVNAVACNQTVANDATASGTIAAQTGTTLATSAALCTDTDINNAIAAAFNAFVQAI
jgi:hypothetical protein